jgi:L-amino acid N-acyltransferase YncA
MGELRVRLIPMEPVHWEAVRRIYGEGIETGLATYETELPDWERWDQGHLPFGRLVAVLDGEVVGWAALSPVSARRVYRGVAEVSVYVAAGARGRGVGHRLLERLVSESEANGIWTLQAGIFPENLASVSLHRRAGFREVGRRERVARLRGTWRDVLLLERRSDRVGTDGGEAGEG